MLKTFFKEHDVFYLGRGMDYATALEASLKLKEISYIHSESYAAGELKHGTIALIEKGVNVIGIMTDLNLVKKTVSNMEEIITRGAVTTAVVSEAVSKEVNLSLFDNVVIVPDTCVYLSSIVTIVPLQLLGYFLFLRRKDWMLISLEIWRSRLRLSKTVNCQSAHWDRFFLGIFTHLDRFFLGQSSLQYFAIILLLTPIILDNCLLIFSLYPLVL